MVRLYDFPGVGGFLQDFRYHHLFDSLTVGEAAIDCGANVGEITRKMAKPGVTVYAFEPDPNAFQALTANLKNFEDVVLINKAVSDFNGRAKLYFHNRYKENPLKWSIESTLMSDKPRIDKDNHAEVEVVDLVDFIRGIDKPIGLLKISVGGEEVKVLNKLIDEGLYKRIRNIAVETHDHFPTLKEPIENLKKKILDKGIKNIDLKWA